MVKNTAFWYVKPIVWWFTDVSEESSVSILYLEDGSTKSLQNFGEVLPGYATLHPT